MSGTIRRARGGDVAAVTRCVRSAYAKYVERIVTDGDEPVGTITMRPEGDHLFVGSRAVSPDAQGRGLGRRLMEFAADETLAANLPEIRLYTNEKMWENLAFYERLGFEETHRKKDEGYSRVFLRKPVDAGGGDGGGTHLGR